MVDLAHPLAVQDACRLDDPDLLVLRPHLLAAGLWVLAYDPWSVVFGRCDYTSRVRADGTVGYGSYAYGYVSRMLLEDGPAAAAHLPYVLAEVRARWDGGVATE